MVPTVDNLDALKPLFLRANSPPAYIEQVFFSNERLAALEECQGAWRPVVDDLISQQQGGDESVAALAAQFRQHVQPLERKRSTRQKLATSWNTVVT